jgi:hypothetical protein
MLGKIDITDCLHDATKLIERIKTAIGGVDNWKMLTLGDVKISFTYGNGYKARIQHLVLTIPQKINPRFDTYISEQGTAFKFNIIEGKFYIDLDKLKKRINKAQERATENLKKIEEQREENKRGREEKEDSLKSLDFAGLQGVRATIHEHGWINLNLHLSIVEAKQVIKFIKKNRSEK